MIFDIMLIHSQSKEVTCLNIQTAITIRQYHQESHLQEQVQAKAKHRSKVAL